MSRIIITDKRLQLSIGVFTIHISQRLSYNKLYYLPDSAEQFLDSKDMDTPELNINYTIQLEDSFQELEDTPAAGFDDGPYPYRIYRISSDSFLWIRKNKYNEIQVAFRISNDWTSWSLVADNSKSSGSNSFTELAYIFAYSILNKGGILFHGVVMEWRGMGIIVCAHSGVGKTTHTSMWRDNENALILNGDRALCCREDDRWYTYGAPWSGSSGENRNRRVELGVVVILEQAKTNEVSVLSPLQGALELIPLAFAPDWEEKLINCALDTIDNIARSIPVLKLRCRPDLEAVAILKAELEKLTENKNII